MDPGCITASWGRVMEGEKSGVDMVSYCCERERVSVLVLVLVLARVVSGCSADGFVN